MFPSVPEQSRWERARYNYYAPVYDAAVARATRPARERSFARLNAKRGERVLIVGAGTGLDFPHVPAGVHVNALEMAPRMLARAHKRAVELKRPVECVLGDAQRLPFEDGAFDAVVLHLILAIVPDPIACAREAARVLTPGGRVAILDKFLPDLEGPSSVRRVLNAMTRRIATDINRNLGPILDAAHLHRDWEEPAPGLPRSFRIAVARRVGD